MRTDLIFRHNFTFDYWDFHETQNVSGATEKDFYYAETLTGFFSDGRVNQMVVLTNKPLKVNAIVRNVRDRAGKQIIVDRDYRTRDMTITSIDPQYDVFGRLINYMAVLV